MPLPPDFAAESLYAPEAWFVHDLVELDEAEDRLVGRIDTTRLGPLVDAQRVFPGHAKHFPGAVAIQVTGTLGQLHAIYVMGLRSTQGWFGFGTHIKKARFPRLGVVGPEVLAHLRATRKRRLRGTWFVDYDFRFVQEGQVIYESTQTAAWGQAEAAAETG